MQKEEWSEWDEYAVLGSRWMDWIGRVVTRPSYWERRESTTSGAKLRRVKASERATSDFQNDLRDRTKAFA